MKIVVGGLRSSGRKRRGNGESRKKIVRAHWRMRKKERDTQYTINNINIYIIKERMYASHTTVLSVNNHYNKIQLFLFKKSVQYIIIILTVNNFSMKSHSMLEGKE